MKPSRQTMQLRERGVFKKGAAVRLAPIPLYAPDDAPDDTWSFPQGSGSHYRQFTVRKGDEWRAVRLTYDNIGHILSVKRNENPNSHFDSHTITVQWMPDGHVIEHHAHDLELLPVEGV